MTKRLFQFFLVFLTLFIVGVHHSSYATASNEEPDQYVFVRLLADKTQVSGGDTIRIGLEQIIHPKWHTYWKNPGDSGLPTSIDWNLPEGFSVSELEWPTPLKIPFGPLTNYGYEGTVTLLQNLTVPENTGNMPYQLDATVNLLVCHDICIPESHDVSIVLNGTTPAEPQKIQAAEENIMSQPLDIEAGFYRDGDNFVLDIPADIIDTSNIKSVTLLPEEWGGVDNTADAQISKTSNGVSVSQKIGDRDFSEFENFPAVLDIKNSDGTETTFKIEAKQIKNPNRASGDDAAAENSGVSTFLQAILFALFGGIILNLMPCVFPVLSMKALSLVNLHKEEENIARKHGIAYTVGILLSFAIIGGVLLILKAGGAQIGWGFQLQTPLIILALTYLVFIIGLNLAGFFEFSNKLAGIGQKQTQAEGSKGAFFTGVLATLVATPCTAPFMGVALGYALTQPAIISMSVFLALGFGLALPYLALCFVPSLRSKLPKPGVWMDTFKQFLSFPMFITAAWLVWVLARQGGEMAVLLALLGMIAIALTIWLAHHIPSNKIWRLKVIALLIASALFTVSTLFTVNTFEQSTTVSQEAVSVNWEDFSNEKLGEYLNTDQPVFINMTAAWCITCQVNDKIALKTDKTRQLFSDKNVAYLKGDWTNKDSEITKYLNKFDRQGVPLYVFYPAPDAQTGVRPDPEILPQILTGGIVEKTVTKFDN
ncbi:MAG: thioredoxin family protein [Pseudomonadota bacterium]